MMIKVPISTFADVLLHLWWYWSSFRKFLDHQDQSSFLRWLTNFFLVYYECGVTLVQKYDMIFWKFAHELLKYFFNFAFWRRMKCSTMNLAIVFPFIGQNSDVICASNACAEQWSSFLCFCRVINFVIG